MKAYRFISDLASREAYARWGFFEFVTEHFFIRYDGSMGLNKDDLNNYPRDNWEECELELTPEQKIQLVKLRMS